MAVTYEEIAVEHALKLAEDKYRHASHVMVYAQWPGKLFGKYEHKYAVLVSAYPIECTTASTMVVVI